LRATPGTPGIGGKQLVLPSIVYIL
jgi:hypothetical protein